MTARITEFVTRAEAGLIDARSVSHNITPEKGGVTEHYGGPAQRIRSHADCVSRWRGWQAYHMRPGGLGVPNGAADIAYNGGACDHGAAFAGRGIGVRSGANGTANGNQNFYAFTWIGGEGETPTQAALDALDWWIHKARTEGGAGDFVVPHSWHKPTGCPGDPVREHAASRDRKAIVMPDQFTLEVYPLIGASADDTAVLCERTAYSGQWNAGQKVSLAVTVGSSSRDVAAASRLRCPVILVKDDGTLSPSFRQMLADIGKEHVAGAFRVGGRVPDRAMVEIERILQAS